MLRCPKEILPHLDSIVSTSLRLIKHDPNYADEDEEDEMDQDEDEDEEDEYSDDGDYSGSVPPFSPAPPSLQTSGGRLVCCLTDKKHLAVKGRRHELEGAQWRRQVPGRGHQDPPRDAQRAV